MGRRHANGPRDSARQVFTFWALVIATAVPQCVRKRNIRRKWIAFHALQIVLSLERKKDPVGVCNFYHVLCARGRLPPVKRSAGFPLAGLYSPVEKSPCVVARALSSLGYCGSRLARSARSHQKPSKPQPPSISRPSTITSPPRFVTKIIPVCP